jgi:hypothetical protein
MATKTTKKTATENKFVEKDVEVTEGEEKITETEPPEPKEFKEGVVPLEEAEEDFDPKKITSDEGEDEQDAYYGSDENSTANNGLETDTDDFLPEEFKENNW